MYLYVTNCWREGRGKLSFQCLRPFGPQTKTVKMVERSSLKSVLKKIESFCNAATIHGFQYIVDQSLGIFFRVLWLIIITVSFTIAGFLISLSFKA
jgi:hypothetical protein